MSSENDPSWLEGDLDAAAEMLAKRAVLGRYLRQIKQADMSQLLGAARERLSSLGEAARPYANQAVDWAQEHPELALPLGGAAAGGALAGLSSLRAPREQRRPLRSALTGALAGAGIGGGAYLAHRGLTGMPLKPTVFSRQLPGNTQPGVNIAHPDQTPQYTTDPTAIQHMKEELQPNPVLGGIKKWLGLGGGAGSGSGAGVPGTAGAGGDGGFLGNYRKNHPILATLLGLDIASNTLGTAAGLADEVPVRPTQFSQAVERWAPRNPGELADALNRARSEGTPQTLQEMLKKLRMGETVDLPAGATPRTGTAPRSVPFTPGQAAKVFRQGVGVRMGGPASASWLTLQLRKLLGGKPSANEGLRGTGHYSSFGPHPPRSRAPLAAALENAPLRALEADPLHRVHGWKGRLAPRVALYGALPFILDRMREGQTRNERLQSILQQIEALKQQ